MWRRRRWRRRMGRRRRRRRRRVRRGWWGRRRHMRRRWRRWGRHARRGRRRRRRRMWRRCGRGPGRRRRGRCRLRRRCPLRRLLGLSVGAEFFLGLRHDHRRAFRMRRRGCQLHRRERGRGEQQETKVCHDGLDSSEKSWRRVWRLRSRDQQIDVRPDCGGPRRRTSIYFFAWKARMRNCSLRIQGIQIVNSRCPPGHLRLARIHIGLRAGQLVVGIGCRGRRAWSVRSSHRKFIGRLTRQLFRLRRFAGLPDRRRYLRPWAARRILRRRLGRIARRRRRNLGRFDRHLQR
jgi:hypothetical protein